MAVEIEKKYLVQDTSWKNEEVIKSATRIKQGYLSSNEDGVVRVRTRNDKAYLTIKGRTKGISRLEFEYEIPMDDANDMIENLCGGLIIDKIRYTLDYEGKTWEIDEFFADNYGLIVAEIELTCEDEVYKLPEWIKMEVNESRYTNASLITHPFNCWTDEERLE